MREADRRLIKGAVVVSMDPEIGTLSAADILIERGRIAKVAPAISADGAELVDGADWVVAPGFVDTHRHTWLSAIRHTYGDVDPLSYFDEVLGGAGPLYTPEDVFAGTLLGAVSALSSGTTTLLDWAHIQNSPEHADSGIEALRDSGIRAVYGHGWPMSADGTWTNRSTLHHPDDIRRLADELGGSVNPSHRSRITLSLAARGPEMATDEVWERESQLARSLGLRMSVHVGAYSHNANVKAVEQYARKGLLTDQMTFVHCSRTSVEEIALIADAGASVSLGVHCELNSQGIGDIPLDTLLEHDIRPSLSGDNETKCSGDMFTQMRALFGYYRSWVGGEHSVIEQPCPITLRDVLEFATISGARALGLDGVTGSITPGKEADLVCVRMSDLNLAPVSDPVAALVLGAHEGNVDSVLVSGEFVKRGGRMLYIDPKRVVEIARESQRRLYPARQLRSSQPVKH